MIPNFLDILDPIKDRFIRSFKGFNAIFFEFLKGLIRQKNGNYRSRILLPKGMGSWLSGRSRSWKNASHLASLHLMEFWWRFLMKTRQTRRTGHSKRSLTHKTHWSIQSFMYVRLTLCRWCAHRFWDTRPRKWCSIDVEADSHRKVDWL